MELTAAFPGDSIVGEETSEILSNDPNIGRQVLALVNHSMKTATLDEIISAIDVAACETDFSGRFWTLDPIDGTKGFLRGGQYAVALSLIEKGEVVLGVLGCPGFPVAADKPTAEPGCLVYAVKGQGAWIRALNGNSVQPVSADGVSDPAQATFCESFEKAHASRGTHQKISSALGIVSPPLRMDSQVKYAAVARGDASIYLRLPRSKDYEEKIWDHAAGAIVVEEAGGKVTDFRGRPLKFSTGRTLRNNGGIAATNGRLHRQLLDAISRVVH
jgi:3'(2'), 5'-bisphosphate nucleotidase